MTKYKIVIGIIMTVVTLSCIIASSFAWFSASRDTVDGTGASLTAKDPSILTVSEDIFTIQDMGNYKGQTSFAFYRYIEDEENLAFEGKYILDKDGNKITKNFPAYNYIAQMKENRTFVWSGTQDNLNGTYENVGVYNLRVTASIVSGVSIGDRFYLRVNNSFDYAEPADDFYLRNVDGNTLCITDTDGNVVYEDSFNPISIEKMFNAVTVSVGGTSSFTCRIGDINQNYSTYSNTDNTTTVYDRLVSADEAKRYSIKGIDGAITYDSINNDTEITFDRESGVTSVSKIVRTDEGTCKKIYEDSDGNLTIEDKMFRIVQYVTEDKTFYKIYDKALRPNCIYDGETDGVSVAISETEVTTYAIDDGKDMEDSAYTVAIQFEMLLNANANTEYYLQFTPNTLGIVPVSDSAKEKLLAIEGTTIGDVYYTYIDSDKIIFGLDVTDEYKNEVSKTTTVQNYEGDCQTVTNILMNRIGLDKLEYGKVRYETTKGYDVYYSTGSEDEMEYLTYDVIDSVSSYYVDIRGEKIAYNSEKHGDLIYSLKTTKGFEIYVRDNEEYSSVLDQKGNLINDNYKESLIFAYNYNGSTMCALYSKITSKNRDRIAEGIENDTLYIEISSSVVYDAKDKEILYSSDKGNVIATTKRLMYFLPLSTLFKNFTMEVDLIDHTKYNDDTWDNLTAEEKNNLINTYKIDNEGKIVNADGSLVTFKEEYATKLLLYCVARVYYADPYTFDNMHSDTELKYNYDYNLATPMFTVESSGSLQQFAYSDYAFMGSHFLIRLNVESGEKGAND